MSKLNYHVVSEICQNTEDIITTTSTIFNGIEQELYKRIIRTQDQSVREALIRLGWTPPTNQDPRPAPTGE